MASDLKLVYFDIRGRGEPIRLMLAAAGQAYVDERISFSDWPAKKSTTPFGALPYIVYKGKISGQTAGISKYLAKKFGMYGKTDEDALRIDETMGLVDDQLVSGFVKYRFAKNDADKAEALKKILEEDLPKFFAFYEKFLKENGGTGYIVGDRLSIADLFLYDMQDNVLQLKKDGLKGFPLLEKLRQNVETNPKVKAYLSKRKETPF